jgi:hypothetical protein
MTYTLRTMQMKCDAVKDNYKLIIVERKELYNKLKNITIFYINCYVLCYVLRYG